MASAPLKSLSQIWNTKQAEESASGLTQTQNQTRRALTRQFNSTSNTTQRPSMMLRSRNVLTSISNLNVASVPKETRKLINAGAEKMQSTLRDVRVTIGTWSQRLKNPTRRRQRLLQGSPYTPSSSNRRGNSPHTKQILGRTPTKLYSPFGIETPSENQPKNFHMKNTPKGKRGNIGSFDPTSMYSPTRAFPGDVKNMRRGVEDFNRAAEGVVRRSLRQQMSTGNM